MNTNCRLVCALLVAVAAASAAAADLLTVGTPAPPLEAEPFLHGEAVKELSKGSIYVIEFSGTNCAPCIEAIPHLSKLQKKHPNVIFISIYCEKEADVRKFLGRNGEQMSFRVAMDRDFSMQKNWQEASRLTGIPTVFLVGADGIIAWIGSPADLDAPLENILAGNLNLRLERLRSSFQQADNDAFTTWEARQKQISEIHRTINGQIEKRQWVEAVRSSVQAAHDFPEAEFEFLNSKLYALADNPATTDLALKFAAELSARMRFSSGDIQSRRLRAFDVEIAQSLADRQGNADPLLLEAARILLGKAEEALPQAKDEDARLMQKKYIRQVSAMVAARKKDFVTAVRLLREALEILRQRKCSATTAEGQKEWEHIQREYTREIEDELAKNSKAATLSRP